MWGPSLIYEYRPIEFTRHAQWRLLTVVQVSKQGCVSITSWQHLTWHFMTPARHKNRFIIIIKTYFRHVAMLQKFASPRGGPFLLGAPVRPNMMNMPKSASVCHCLWDPNANNFHLGPLITLDLAGAPPLDTDRLTLRARHILSWKPEAATE